MYRHFLQSFLTFLLLTFLICLAPFLYGQNNSVKSKKVFTCQNDDAGVKVDSFPSPDGAVEHYISKHMPSGFKLKPGTIEVLENGWVVFTTHKNGEQEASQGGHVLGHVLCPPDSWVSDGAGGSFDAKVCMCNQGLVAYGDSCKRPEDIPKEEDKDECATKSPLTKPQQLLKEKTTARLKEVVAEENRLLANDLSRAKQVLSPDELTNYGNKFFAGYGHALERLTDIAVKKDPFLSSVLQYITNAEQRAAGGGPDFRGKGKLPATVEFDITTPKAVAAKKKKDDKKCYEFITYDRLTDKQGNSIDE